MRSLFYLNITFSLSLCFIFLSLFSLFFLLMSVKTRQPSGHTSWNVTYQFKELLKKREKTPPLSPPLPSSVPSTKTKPSSLIYRIFPSSKNKNKAMIQLKKQQWDQPETEMDLYESSEVPIRTHLISFFSPQHQKQDGWTQLLTTEKLDEMSRIYMATLHKIRSLSHYSMEQQINILHLLHGVQANTASLQQQYKKPFLTRVSNQHRLLFQREFSSLISGKAVADSILTGNRKPKRTRYIFMLLSAPASHVIDRVHPVTDALRKIRKPYAETFRVITAKQKQTTEFVSAEYLLDPITLHTDFYSEELYHRLGTKLSCTAITKGLSRENMTKIQVQTN
ncbi:uncharacterized protein B0P05DRAFT_552467 [Gilbertella persicaria]|uniref:uncharacterized protein n=1 Tax=Gilbertella persicaria TaxID=101096 RepID=UPI00222000E9|nr:uncharacterized protein B0P05DRAFT_552467 [Gilbertella persicaria]KAI8067664.1 hypothetical protein B0P05DRAFT_552467 [Gilbertella persicaria]